MITKNKILQDLKITGLTNGDILFVHSSLKTVGPIVGGAETLLNALLETIGGEGVLAMPAFNYTRPLPDPYFDINKTPALTGVLTEIFRKMPKTKRSLHPTHSICAQGKKAEEILSTHIEVEAVGINSPIDKIAKAGGYVMLIGVTHMANTTIHIGEAYADVKKFHWKKGTAPVAKIKMLNGIIGNHTLDPSASCDTTFNVIEHPMRSAGKIIDFKIGNAVSYLMKGQDIIDATVSLIEQQPDILFCNDPHCRPCSISRKFLNNRLIV